MHGPSAARPRRARRRSARALSLLAVALLALTAAARAQAPPYVVYGDGCGGLFDAPRISFGGSLLPGSFAHVRVEGAQPSSFVVLHIGTSDTTSPWGPLPLDLSPLEGVGPGCMQYTSAQYVFVLPTTPAGTLQMGFKVPFGLGSDMYFQFFAVEQFEPLSVSATPGLHASLNTNPNLHVVMLTPEYAVDYDEDGSEAVLLDGSDSHTHQIGHSLTAFKWREGATVLSQTDVVLAPLAVGEHELSLLITDDNAPPHTLLDTTTLRVVPPQSVPGIAARYHDATGTGPLALLDAPPPLADWTELLDALLVADEGGTVGHSPFGDEVLVVLEGAFTLTAAGTYTVAAGGGADRRLFVDGAPASGRAFLAAGEHAVEARFAVTDLAQLPLTVTVSQGGHPLADLLLTHDETQLLPVLNAVTPALGTSAGGNAIVLEGRGFFPHDDVVVHWGEVELTAADNLAIEADRIAFTAPPHAPATLAVSIETPRGTSNARSFEYSDDGPVPVNFVNRSLTAVAGPTAGAWGPDGRFYVTTIDGELKAIRYNDDLTVQSVSTYAGVSNEPNFNSLGITFNPFDPPAPVRVYVSHALIAADGGTTPTGPSSYLGAVSILEGPDFDDPLPLLTGLPQPNTPHQINGIEFDHNGDLILLSGACTNAGVAWPTIGDLPESPLSAAALKAHTSRPDFVGAVHYVATATGLPNDDQRFGEVVDVAPGSHVTVHAPGLRNPYDLVLATSGRLYATDNGPNDTYGPQSTGPSSSGPHPAEPDEILLVEAGQYYGHPNRNRGRTDPRQNVYRGPAVPSLPGEFTRALAHMASSVDGLTEYRSDAFGGQMRGELVAQKWIGPAYRVRLAPDGRAVEAVLPITPSTNALDIDMAPGGGLVATNYTSNVVQSLAPVDGSSTGALRVLDLTPWRGPQDGGTPFVIGGEGFGTLADTSVTIGGLAATLTAVRPTRIEGITPAQPSPTTALLDVAVTRGAQSDVLPAAWRYLFTPAGNEPGRWETAAPLPLPLGDVAAGVLDGTLHLFSHDTAATYTLDLLAGGGWQSGTAPRPFPGGGHAVEVLGDLLYVIGGHENGAEGRVQIYDLHDDAWTAGADLPWGGAGVATAAIDGLIYAAGGQVGGGSVDNCAVYDPTTDAWSPRASLPPGEGRAYAASATDGSRLFVFGGRGVVPYDSVQVYDPGTDTWTTSDMPGSPLAPMPVGRGGTARAAWWQGELYVLGGEGAGGILDRVDVYDPAANTWRVEAAMPTARHDVYPVIFGGRVFVAGGSPVAGHQHTAVVEVFTRQ